MSQYWFDQAKINDLLRLRGPLGTFFLRDQAARDLVLLATGTGIAPVKSILEGLDDLPIDAQPRTVTIYWGGRKQDDLYFQLLDRPRLRFVPVLSRAEDAWQGARGHVQNAFLADTPDMSSALVYACGSDAMIHSAQKVLLDAGLSRHRFHSDAFVCSATA